jgi:hypothetical protein
VVMRSRGMHALGVPSTPVKIVDLVAERFMAQKGTD